MGDADDGFFFSIARGICGGAKAASDLTGGGRILP